MGKTRAAKTRRWSNPLRPRSASNSDGGETLASTNRLCYCGGKFYSSRTCSNKRDCPRWAVGNGSWGRTAKLLRQGPELLGRYPTLRLDKLGLAHLSSPPKLEKLLPRSDERVEYNEAFKQRVREATTRVMARHNPTTAVVLDKQEEAALDTALAESAADCAEVPHEGSAPPPAAMPSSSSGSPLAGEFAPAVSLYVLQAEHAQTSGSAGGISADPVGALEEDAPDWDSASVDSSAS